MKISYNWLKQYLDISVSPQELSIILTNCGLEVEALEKYESVKGGLKGVVIGEVIHKEKHPDADKLSLTKVNIGNDTILNIVCGAPNVAAGQKVAVATIGTELVIGDKPLLIKKSKIRGCESEGMICAEDELGLGTSHEGIMVLESSAIPGTPACEYFKVYEDWVFEIGLTPNRIDAASHIGVARDIAAYYQSIGKPVQLKKPAINNYLADRAEKPIDIIIDDVEACKRYAGTTIFNIEVKESPQWLKNYLLAVGQRPINNIVDITNYILQEYGQPLHAFDADKITGNKVIVKKLTAKTKFITLDGIERELGAADLMICNANEGMCIAGVFGGEKSGVTEHTKNIFLESAYFDPKHIRKTSKSHGLKTDASFRFERGADPDIMLTALLRATALIKEIAGGNTTEIIDIYPRKVEPFKVKLDLQFAEQLIGKKIPENTIEVILNALEIVIDKKENQVWHLLIPPFKVDVTRDVDVIEEIMRIYGYNNIEIPEICKSSLSPSVKPDKEKLKEAISQYLTSNGFHEIFCNSLTNSEYYTDNKDTCVKIINPLSKELEVMRQTMLFSGLEAIAYNQNRKNSDLKLYEIGKTYHYQTNDVKIPLDKYLEKEHVSLFVTGKRISENWYESQVEADFFLMKQFVYNILNRLGLDISKFTQENSSDAYISKGLRLAFKDKTIVEFGIVNKNMLKKCDVKNEVYYADFRLEELLKLLANVKIQYAEIPKFPEVRRDLALLLDQAVQYVEIEKIAYQTAGKLLKQVNLFDIYEGDKIEKGKKSYAISFHLLDDAKTLTDKEIDKTMGKLIQAFEKQLNAKIR